VRCNQLLLFQNNETMSASRSTAFIPISSPQSRIQSSGVHSLCHQPILSLLNAGVWSMNPMLFYIQGSYQTFWNVLAGKAPMILFPVPVNFVPQETALSWLGHRLTCRYSHPCWVLPIPPTCERLRIMAGDIPLSRGGGVGRVGTVLLASVIESLVRTRVQHVVLVVDWAVRDLTSPPAP
jgi:hypothetical protein